MNNLYNLNCNSFGVLNSDEWLESYLNIYKSLICEEYRVFPVPKLLLDDMIDFCLEKKTKSNFKEYHYVDILEKYTINWKYYQQFKKNLELMIESDYYGSITLCTYSTKEELQVILDKFPNSTSIDKIFNTHAMIYSYDDHFDTCLLIKTFKNISKFNINKCIQHELIHWMQFSLNSETGKTYGKFKEQKLNLDLFDLSLLSDLGVNKDYLLSEYEFEPWVANTVEEFYRTGLTVDEYKKIIEDNSLFIDKLKNIKSQGEYEMFVF